MGAPRPRRAPRWRPIARIALWAQAGWALLSGAAAARGPEPLAMLPVDRIELVVEGEAITRSEFLDWARVVVAWQRPEWGEGEPLAPTVLARVRAHLIDAMLIAGQARRLGVANESEEALAAAEARLLAEHPALVGLEPLREVLRQARHNDLYLAERLALRGAPSPRGGEGLPPVKHRLGSNPPALEAWLVDLRRAAHIRVVAASGLLEVPLSSRAAGEGT